MRILLLIAYILCIGTVAMGQQRANPFEVRQSRMHVSEKSDSTRSTLGAQPFDTTKSAKSISITNKKSNPFEVRSHRSSDWERKVEPMRQSTLQSPSQPAQKLVKPKRRPVIIAVIILISLLAMSMGISYNQARVRAAFKTLYNSNALKTQHRALKSWREPQIMLLYICFWINASLFVYMLYDADFKGMHLPVSWWMIPLIVFVIYWVRHFITFIIGFIFEIPNICSLYNFSVGVHNILLGMFILPIVIGLQFGPDGAFHTLAIIGICMFLLVYALRQGKALLHVFSLRDFNMLYFFIYLCAVEIAPILFLIKMGA